MNKAELKKLNRSLAGMFSCFPQSAFVDTDMQMDAYCEALNEANFADIQIAIGRFLRGEVKTVNSQFVPSSAQLCIEVRAQRALRETVLNRKPASRLKPVLPPHHFQMQRRKV